MAAAWALIITRFIVPYCITWLSSRRENSIYYVFVYTFWHYIFYDNIPGVFPYCSCSVCLCIYFKNLESVKFSDCLIWSVWFFCYQSWWYWVVYLHVILNVYISFFLKVLLSFNVSIVQSAYVPVLIRCISPVTISLIIAIYKRYSNN